MSLVLGSISVAKPVAQPHFADNPNCAKDSLNFVTDSPSQFALRQWWRHICQPRTLVGLGGAVLVLTLAGPFRTETALGLPLRFAYWALTVLGSYSLGTLTFGYFARTSLAKLGHLRTTLVIAFISAALVTVLVAGLNRVFLGLAPSLAQAPVYIGTIFVVALIISLVISFLMQPASEGDATERDGGPEAPRLLARLPIDKRGPLVAISSEDHYVRIRTLHGEEMVLMRLSDAIDEAAPAPGLQVHRSHWVATDQVRAARRDGDRAVLTVHGDVEIPVSRANVAAIRAAGLLPK